jgi:hypothetical protein
MQSALLRPSEATTQQLSHQKIDGHINKFYHNLRVGLT